MQEPGLNCTWNPKKVFHSIMTLWDLTRNQKARVDKFVAGLDPQYIQRLRDLGLREGEEVICMRRSFLNGPRVYQVSGSLLALEKELATAVTVSGVSQ